jgi:hypothetical protein
MLINIRFYADLENVYIEVWSIICKENQVEFDEYYWGSITASIKIIKIRSQDFPTDHTWRHDPFNFDVPTGSSNHPRILLKFYHD